MKKLILVASLVLLLQSCYTGYERTTVGAISGGMLGGAVGGFLGGFRGHDVGTVIGALAGAAIGASADRNAYDRTAYNDHSYDEGYRDGYRRARETSSNNDTRSKSGDSFPSDCRSCHTTGYSSIPFSVRNIRFIDDGRNQVINAAESGKIVFELTNNSSKTYTDVILYVTELSGSEHITLSPSTRIASMQPGETVRYTFHLKTDQKINEGTFNFRIAVSSSDSDVCTLREFALPTSK